MVQRPPLPYRPFVRREHLQLATPNLSLKARPRQRLRLGRSFTFAIDVRDGLDVEALPNDALTPLLGLASVVASRSGE